MIGATNRKMAVTTAQPTASGRSFEVHRTPDKNFQLLV